MSYELDKQLTDIETNIREAIISGDNFQYQKLLRMKSENQDSQYFAETKNLREKLDALESDRSFAFSVRDDLLSESKQAAAVVSEASGVLLEAQRVYAAVQARQYFNDTQIEIQRKDIQELKRKLESHINSKLNSVEQPEMEN